MTSPPVTSTAPGASKLLAVASRLSDSRMGARTSPARPTGTLTKKIHSQLSRSVSTPPSRTPATAPTAPTAPQAPSAVLRSLPSANVVVRIESAAGVISAAPSPCRARAPISAPSLHASPESSEAAVKITSPTTKTRRRPTRSATRPPSRRKPPNISAYALTTHCRFSCEKPRSAWIEGSATFTIAMSRTTMNCTPRSSASTIHLRSFDAIIGVVLSFLKRSLARLKIKLQNCKYDLVYRKRTGYPDDDRDQKIRPVLSDGPRPLPRGRSLGAPDRARAAARPQALHRPVQRAAGHRHEHPRDAPSRPGARRHPAEAAAAAA